MKTLTGKTITVEIDVLDSVLVIKKKIHEKEGIPPDQQLLIYEGKECFNNNIIAFTNIKKECTLHLVLRLRGQGDLISNHIVATIPINKATDVALDSLITFKFDDDKIKLTQTSGCLIVKEKKSQKNVEGTICKKMVNDNEKCIVFTPNENLKPNTEYMACLKSSNFSYTTDCSYNLINGHPLTFTTMSECDDTVVINITICNIRQKSHDFYNRELGMERLEKNSAAPFFLENHKKKIETCEELHDYAHELVAKKLSLLDEESKVHLRIISIILEVPGTDYAKNLLQQNNFQYDDSLIDELNNVDSEIDSLIINYSYFPRNCNE